MADRLRFYFDQHVPVAVALSLRRRGIEVLTAQEASCAGAPMKRNYTEPSPSNGCW